MVAMTNNCREVQFSSPSPLAGEGWGGGTAAVVVVKCGVFFSPPPCGEGSGVGYRGGGGSEVRGRRDSPIEQLPQHLVHRLAVLWGV